MVNALHHLMPILTENQHIRVGGQRKAVGGTPTATGETPAFLENRECAGYLWEMV